MKNRLLLAVALLAIAIRVGPAQEPKKDDLAAKPPWQRLLQGDEAKKAEELAKKISDFRAKDDYSSCAELAKELHALRARAQGEDHHQTVGAKWQVEYMTKLAALGNTERAEWHELLQAGTRAAAFERQRNFGEAATGRQAMLDGFRKLFGEENPFTVHNCNSLALDLNSLGRCAEAETLVKRALAISQKTVGEEDPLTAKTCKNLAFVLNTEGKHAEALPIAIKGLAIRRKVLGELHPDTGESFNNVAFTLWSLGKYAEAEPLFLSALTIRERVFGNESLITSITYDDLAKNLSALGRYAEAAAHYKKALAICQKQGNRDNVGAANVYTSMAINATHQGNYAEAEQYVEKANAIHEKLLGEDHRQRILGYGVLAGCFESQGRYAEAEPLFRKCLAAHRKTVGERHPETTAAYSTLFGSIYCQGRLDEALTLMTSWCSSYEASRLMAAPRGADSASFRDIGQPYPFLSAAKARLKQPREAFAALEAHLARGLLDELAGRLGTNLTPAEESLQRAVVARLDAIQPRIASLIGSGRRKEAEQTELDSLMKERNRLERQLSELAVDASKRQVADPAEIQRSLGPDEALLFWIDLDDQSGGLNEHWGGVLRATGDPAFEPLPKRGANGRSTKEDLQLADTYRRALAGKTATIGEIDALARQLQAQRLAPLEKHLRGVKKLYVVAVDVMVAIPIDALTDRFTVSYVPSGTFLARLKGKRAPASSGILALGDPVFSTPGARAQPVELPPGGLLVLEVVPDGIAAKNGLQAGDVLLSYAGTELTSADQLPKLIDSNAGARSVEVKVWRGSKKDKITILDVQPGNPGMAWDRRPAPQAIAERRKAEQFLALRGPDLDELPGTRVEVESLAKLFGNRATLLLDSNASEQRLEELRSGGALAGFRYLHFATHGQANNFRSFESVLFLSTDKLPAAPLAERGKPFINGQLSAREVLEYWKLDAELVTLSACETALGRFGGGDGLLGFAQAFLTAGARSVCLSLWKVDDAATALLMGRFYQDLLGRREGLEKPLPKAEALAEAKRWLRDLSYDEALKQCAALSGGVVRGERGARKLNLALPEAPKTEAPVKQIKPFAHPKFWAGFILIGDPN